MTTATSNGQVGLIGVGAMGSALLSRLAATGRKVLAYDIAPAGKRAAEEGGAVFVKSAAEAATGCDFVHVFVRTDEDVVESVLGRLGALTGAPAGCILLLHTTNLPATTYKVASAAAEVGVEVLDAPLTSVPRRVKEGKGAFLVGGSVSAVAKARAYLSPLGADVYHFGPLGCGNIAKLGRNLHNAVEKVALAEILRFMASSNVDIKMFLAMMQGEDEGSLVSKWEKAFVIQNNHVTMNEGSNLFSKDLPLSIEFARSIGTRLAVAEQVGSSYGDYIPVKSNQ